MLEGVRRNQLEVWDSGTHSRSVEMNLRAPSNTLLVKNLAPWSHGAREH